MTVVNTDNILYGDPVKTLYTLHDQAVRENTEEASEKYAQYYRTLDLSILLEHSQIIFSDAYQGLSFFTNLILEQYIPFHEYYLQYCKLDDFIKAHQRDFSGEEKDLYNNALNSIKEKKKKTCVLGAYSDTYCTSDPDVYTAISDIFDLMYRNKDKAFSYDYDDPERTPDSTIMNAIDLLKGNPMLFLLYGPLILGYFQMDYDLIHGFQELIPAKCESYNELCEGLGRMMFLSNLMAQPLYIKILKKNANPRVFKTIADLVYTDVKDIVSTYTAVPDIKPMDSPIPVTESFDPTIDVLSFALEEVEEILEDPILSSIKEDAVRIQMETISSFLESTLIPVMVELGEEASTTEYNGMIPFKTTTRTVEGLVKEAGEQLCHLLQDEDVFENYIESVEDEYSSFEKEFFSEANEEEEDDDVEEDEPKAPSPKKAKESSDSEDTKKPPKQSFIQKIKNKAMDKEKEFRDKTKKMDEGKTAVKHAGKAATTIPSYIGKQIDDMLYNMRGKKKKRYQKKLLKDGYRSAAWKRILKISKFAAVTAISPLLVPFYWVGRQIAKSGNAKLKKEIVADFNLEIEILKDKYENAKNNNKEKDQYRIKRELDRITRERDRIVYNTKQVN